MESRSCYYETRVIFSERWSKRLAPSTITEQHFSHQISSALTRRSTFPVFVRSCSFCLTMRRIPRSQQSIDSLLISSRHAHSRSPSLCRACQFRSTSLPLSRHPSTFPVAALSTSSSAQYAIMERNPEKSKQFTDKLRKKIWGTEDVPGREDPYSPDSPMRVPGQVVGKDEGKSKELGVEESSEEEQVEWEREMEEERAFKPAQTWDGLERVGSKQWAEKFREWRRGRPHFEKT